MWYGISYSQTAIPYQTPFPLHFMTSFPFQKHWNGVLPHHLIWIMFWKKHTTSIFRQPPEDARKFKYDLISLALFVSWPTPCGCVISFSPQGKRKWDWGMRRVWHNNAPHPKWKLGVSMTKIFTHGAPISLDSGEPTEGIHLQDILSPSHRNIPWYPSSVPTLTRVRQQSVFALPCCSHNFASYGYI